MLITIVESHDYLRQAEKLGVDQQTRDHIAQTLAHDPEVGQPLGGGLFKMRVARRGQGKSGGYRLVYFFKPIDAPVFILSIFAKNRKDNLTFAEKVLLTEEAREIGKGR